jgi:hypothetical protein
MSNQRIIALAGRKQSGKNTSYNCMKLWLPDAQEFAFAEPLKRMCVDILGISEKQAFGSDDDKNSVVPHLLWENFPAPAWRLPDGTTFMESTEIPPKENIVEWLGSKTLMRFWEGEGPEPERKTGPMTAREVMQYWGSEIFRRAYSNVWADACIRKIRASACDIAVITDCRFENELQTVQSAGGKVIKLTRNIFPDDKHPSETAFDPENFDQSRFDVVIDNQNMDVSEQCEVLYGTLRRWGLVESKHVGRIHI